MYYPYCTPLLFTFEHYSAYLRLRRAGLIGVLWVEEDRYYLSPIEYVGMLTGDGGRERIMLPKLIELLSSLDIPRKPVASEDTLNASQREA